MKKMLRIIVALTMIICLLPMSAFAAELTPDVEWYNAEATTYEIDTAAELAGLAKLVNDGTNFKNKTITLTADIDLENAEWTPIGRSGKAFQGTFDGNGKTISNLVVTGNNSNVGLFGYTTNGAIKDLTINNAKVSGYLEVGVVTGTPYTSTYSNVKVTGHVEVNGFAYVGGVGGKNAYANWTDIVVDVDDTSYVNAVSTNETAQYRTYVGGVIGFIGEGGHTFKNITSNIDVTGDVCDVGGITGIAHYGNVFENVTCTGNVTNTTSDAEEISETGGIAGVWHNENGKTVTFTNCSYTGKVTVSGEDVTTSSKIVGAPYSSTKTGSLIINGSTILPTEASIGGGILVDRIETNEEAGIYFELVKLPTNAKHVYHVELFSDETYIGYKEIELQSEGSLGCTFYTVGTSSSWKQNEWTATEELMPTHAVFYIDGVKIGSDKVEFTAEEWYAFPGTEHTIETIKGKDATCTENGLTDGSKCSVCGETLDEQEVIESEGHTLKEFKEVPATCTEDGTKAYFECTVCEEAWFDKEMTKEINAQSDLVIESEGHKEVKVDAKAPTCTETGLTEGSKCSVCGEAIKAQTTVEALGHDYKEGVCTVCEEKDPDYVAPELEIEVEDLPAIDPKEEVEEVVVGVNKAETTEILTDTVDEIVETLKEGEEVEGVSSAVATVIAGAIANEDDIAITTTVVVTPLEEKDVEKATITLITETAGKATVAQYLDLSVLMNVEVNGTKVVEGEEVTKLAKPMTFTIAIPEELKEVEEGYERTYFIVRVHEGKTEKLPVKVNADGTLSFSTDRFSNYALAYEDTLKTITQTGDANLIIPFAAAMLLSGAVLVLLKKREEFVK